MKHITVTLQPLRHQENSFEDYDILCQNCSKKLNVYVDTLSGSFKHELVTCPICKHEFFLTAEQSIEYIIDEEW